MKFKNKQTIAAIQKLKKNATPFTAITAYDFPTALIINQFDIPIVLFNKNKTTFNIAL